MNWAETFCGLYRSLIDLRKGVKQMFHVGKFLAFFPPRFKLRNLGFIVGALTTDLRCRGAPSKKIKLFIIIETAQLLKSIA